MRLCLTSASARLGAVLSRADLLLLRLICGTLPLGDYTALYQRTVRVDDAVALCADDPMLVAVEAPATVSSQSATAEMISCARLHGITVGRTMKTKGALLELLNTHVCSGPCTTVAAVFLINKPCIAPPSTCTEPPRSSALPVVFPPALLPRLEVAQIVKEWCDASSAESFCEKACAICARLTRHDDTSRVRDTTLDLAVLERPGEFVTRVERHSLTTPIRELPGPVLCSDGVDCEGPHRYLTVCNPCLGALRRHCLPRHALANGRWVGACPEMLQDLTYVEQLMIARYRHSFCVAQVSLGQRYLAANVVTFGQPVERAYKTLPPPRAEMEQILAILFVGSAKPSNTDVRRTPFLMRLGHIARSIEWLSYNSETYDGVQVSAATLAEYEDGAPPVGIVHRHSTDLADATNTASYESAPDRGVENGGCAFIVHALTEEDLADMPYDAKVAYALRYFERGGKAMAYGHEEEPESIYHNPRLYPGMFPWLYPYGLGGFDNTRMRVKLDHIAHVRANLMYVDRRFQEDRCFPFIVYNQRQIKNCGHGGYLLTQKGYFHDVAQKIVDIDREALDSIIDRAGAGEFVSPRTAGEKSCFDLINIVDRVASHVEGSATQKKFQRNEIRSLIYAQGVPFFFITFAPADFKNPLCLYLCGDKVDLRQSNPLLRSSDDRLRSIARNPVGAARFFHFMVTTFLRVVVRFGSNTPGLFGHPDAYYGTVEAQGRLTLHLHLLLWIQGAVSPQELRDRLLSDAGFETGILDWLEQCHQGQFSRATETELADELEEEYVDSRFGVIVKVVNAMTASAESGGPAICASLLGQPDHYTDRQFRVFYWYPYCKAAKEPYLTDDQRAETQSDPVMLGRNQSGVFQFDKVLDYTCRPARFQKYALYDFMRATHLVRKPSKATSDVAGTSVSEDNSHVLDDDDDGAPDYEDESDEPRDCDDDQWDSDGTVETNITGRGYVLCTGHPLRTSHLVYTRRTSCVLNFIGGPLPRPDRGDREEYCFTMLVFFKPGGWRKGTDLKVDHETWADAYARSEFSTSHLQIMKNMNVLYECLDARDDYAALRREQGCQAGGPIAGLGQDDVDDLDHEIPGLDDMPYDHTQDSLGLLLDESGMGKRSARNRDEMSTVRSLLNAHDGGPVVQYGSRTTARCEGIPKRTAAQWKNLVQSSRQRVMDIMKGQIPLETTNGTRTADVPALLAGSVRVLTLEQFDMLRRLHVDVSRGPQDPHILLLHGVIEMFHLNDEQVRAFSIVARHLHHHDKEPLRMYLGGMAGTGKSTVLKALMSFLRDRGEEHHFIVLGPTGTSAALVGGSTYHSVLGLGVSKDEDSRSSITSLEKIRCRLQRVDLVFIDEVSMISCVDVFIIHTQLTKSFGDSTLSFGGKSVIFAGDFAQLPPPGRAASLYSNQVGVWSRSAKPYAQKCAIGKALWHQFVVVVILRQNMRQRGMSDEDIRFRRALENLRYSRCSREDESLFMSRVCRPDRGDLTYLEPQFRTVSIITARNAHRDGINSIRVRQFAKDHKLPLFRFHSIDRWGRNKGSASVRQAQRHYDRTVDPIRTTNVITPKLQSVLWDIPPALTEHHAGVLELCKGMPILLKYNEATELCATNGAEAIVHDWISHLNGGHHILDTLFVELVNPPRSVQLAGLPENVIPLTRTRRSIRCTLPVDDLQVSVSREQVMVLPNFAMTDFASQGRTRIFNVIHPRFCRNHQSLYTCLSRSASLAGTLMIDSFSPAKIKGGASSSLRKEYRELELLDDITRLRISGSLPDAISGITRGDLLSKYIAWKGKHYVPPSVPLALNWAHASAAELSLSESGYRGLEVHTEAVDAPVVAGKRTRSAGQWTARKRQNPGAVPDRSAYDTSHDVRTGVAPARSADVRIGLIWDSVDHSCGYDALLTVLWNLTVERGLPWLAGVAPNNELLQSVSAAFLLSYHSPEYLEVGRDALRDRLFTVDPQAYPRRGTSGIVLTELMRTLLRSPIPYGSAVTPCTSCGVSVRHVPDVISTAIWPIDPFWWQELFPHSLSVTAQDFVSASMDTALLVPCSSCNTPCHVRHVLISAPPLLILESLPGMTVTPCETVSAVVGGVTVCWRLVGVVYFGWRHYTSRFVDEHGYFWYHDGATTSRHCVRESSGYNAVSLSTARARPHSHLLYEHMS